MENNIHIVYVAYDKNGLCMYVGEGKPNRWKHLISGTSHVYEANRWHFRNKELKIDIIAEGLSKENAIKLEAEKIKELHPAWNRCEFGATNLIPMTNFALDSYKEYFRVRGKSPINPVKMKTIIKDLCKILNKDGETLLAKGQKWCSFELPVSFMSDLASTSGKYYAPLKSVFDVSKVDGGYKVKLKGWINPL